MSERSYKSRAGGLTFTPEKNGVRVERTLNAMQSEWLGIIDYGTLRRILESAPSESKGARDG